MFVALLFSFIFEELTLAYYPFFENAGFAKAGN
jgi:hypothetical protein